MNDRLRAIAVLGLGSGLALAALGCSDGNVPTLVGNERPQVEITARPQPFDSVYYSVRLQWTAWDVDGQVTEFFYAVDPPALGDTAWVSTNRSEVSLFFESKTPKDPLPSPGNPIPSSDFHVFVLRAVDNEGANSAPASIAFTSYTVAPFTIFQNPTPTGGTVLTAPTILIRWSGSDPDGERNDKPIFYKVSLVSEATIKADLGISSTPSSSDIQLFYGRQGPDFAGWETRPPDSTFRQVEGLTAGQNWYFAIVAFDEAGAYEPRFTLSSNVLRFRPITTLAPPKISIGNQFFNKTQSAGGFEIEEHRVVRIEIPSGEPLEFHWFAVPGAQGTEIAGYRWVLDPLGGDVFDETQRETDEQTYRWSSWSLTELAAFFPKGRFVASPGQDVRHRFYVEARDNVGLISLIVVEMRVISPTFSKPLLMFDDFNQRMDRPDGQPWGGYPTEAILDTLLYAVGGVQYQKRPLGTLSRPGMFAGFDYDTLDYRHLPTNGIPLLTLSDYQGVVWYTSAGDAADKNEKFKSLVNVMPAMRMHNTPGNLNTLAVYLSQGGKAWLFGDGIALAVANGYAGRFGQSFGPLPYRHVGDAPSIGSILWPGNFLYDYMKIRSEMQTNGALGGASAPEDLIDCLPFLPQYSTPGAPWPPSGWTGTRGPLDDPRIGPTAQRNVGTWDGLPPLNITTDPEGQVTVIPTTLSNQILYISSPNFILEDYDPGPDLDPRATLDTLYIMRARTYDLGTVGTNADGRPVMFYYHGQEHGELGWTTLPLWWFDRTQLSELATVMLRRWGYTRNTNPREWTGPGDAHSRYGRLEEEELLQ